MKLRKTPIEGVVIIEPDVYFDDRGYFFESYNRDKFRELGLEMDFQQDNESRSAKGVIRGLHFQVPPFDQGKLLRVTSGSAIDVAVDLRKASPTYGKWTSILLSADNKLVFWIPGGFAHGFAALENDTVFNYKCTNVYNKECERTILWDDPDLNIDWQVNEPLISMKDRQAVRFRDFISPF
jgi:dTDP-4-dehydrorhamnose 3,5-epimerase